MVLARQPRGGGCPGGCPARDGSPPASAKTPDVPSDVPVPHDGTRPLPVLASLAAQGRHRAPPGNVRAVPDDGPAGRHRTGASGSHDDSSPTGETDVMVGIAAAARYLGYDNPDSFRRARTRQPIPDERKMPEGRPYWTPAALRSWQSKRKIAGNRIHDGEPD